MFLIQSTKELDIQPLNPRFKAKYSLQQKLYGKALLPTELSEFEEKIVTEHYKNGYIGYKPAIFKENSRFICNRCGNDDPQLFYIHDCARCQKSCTYCRNCIMMGKSQSCSRLAIWTGPDVVFETCNQPLQWSGELSEGQRTASDRVKQAVVQKEECLVWAVCGAGKTEVLFEGIEAALSKGERVCIATPRTDVVLELAPRLKSAFPEVTVAALYGGSEEKEVCAQLVISTTHQLIRYDQAFDVAVIDEVDAFPYSMDASLKFAVGKSRKPQSALIYLTATPSNSMQRNARNRKLPYVTIPARYHRHIIPVPTLKWAGNWKKSFSKNIIPKKLHAWYLQKLHSKTPFLMFFPNIELMNKYLPLFQRDYSEIAAVYAEDPNRKEKVISLRKGERLGLLTTTILERGVTIPNLDVAVIGAEEDIFTESALVQISGRVGRSKNYPKGEIIFFHYGKTTAMIKAIKQIKAMNQMARERGLVDD